jgi:hypothetical protein
MYDNTKFKQAFEAWLSENVMLGFGEHYAGDLLDDFEKFLRKTHMMKRNPGRVVFGQQLAKHGFDKRKRMGLTYWSGLELKELPEKDALAPKRYARTKAADAERFAEQQRLKREAEFEASEEAQAARLAAFKRELEEETKENIEAVGDADATKH